MASSTSPQGTRDPLWVPLLTHYREIGYGTRPDRERMRSHVRSLRNDVWQYLVAGSTGDGWDLAEEDILELFRFALQDSVFDGSLLLFGVLRQTTGEVVALARRAEEIVAEAAPGGARFAGLAVCPPVDAAADQETIRKHFQSVLDATACPIAVYQLPQVTGCSIEFSTLQALAHDPRVIMFKDTSGEDAVARSGEIGGVFMVRGAEGGYAGWLRPRGPYDGWLLSTANAFAPDYRSMLKLLSRCEQRQAEELSNGIAARVERLFDLATALPFGNPFSNANRAADHILAYGPRWSTAEAPLCQSGDRLPHDFLSAAADVISPGESASARGYLSQR